MLHTIYKHVISKIHICQMFVVTLTWTSDSHLKKVWSSVCHLFKSIPFSYLMSIIDPDHFYYHLISCLLTCQLSYSHSGATMNRIYWLDSSHSITTICHCVTALHLFETVFHTAIRKIYLICDPNLIISFLKIFQGFLIIFIAKSKFFSLLSKICCDLIPAKFLCLIYSTLLIKQKS